LGYLYFPIFIYVIASKLLTSIQYTGLNPQPLGHESSALTTRPTNLCFLFQNDSEGEKLDPNTYKTSLCTYYLQGGCRNAEKCHFAHGTNDLR
jgi:hypothetical protein